MGKQAQVFATGGWVTSSWNPAETPDSLRKRAKQLEKAAKAKKREARQAAGRRAIAIEALRRVAKDTKRGYASVEAARELLRIDAE